MKLLYILFLLFTLIVSNHAIQKSDIFNNLKIEWILKDITIEDYNPLTQINLSVNDKIIFTAEASSIEIIEKGNWSNYKIPESAIIACGGWWAGGGTYYYVSINNNALQIFVGYADEALDIEDSYKYKLVKSFTAEAIEEMQKSAVAPVEEKFDYEKFENQSSAPQTMFDLFNDSKLPKNYEIDYFSNNPYYLHGDFDGDNKEDYVLNLISKNHKDADNLIFILGGNKKVYDLNTLEIPWHQAWYTHNKNISLKYDEYDTFKYPKLIGDAIVIMKLESSSALIYWDGRKFRSIWLGD